MILESILVMFVKPIMSSVIGPPFIPTLKMLNPQHKSVLEISHQL